jgi:aspartyl-tRNA(Asn)/glutamyl-tRNA(Gln) amidotransferase subunit B
MLKGSKKLGDRVEVKNMNSLRNIKKAIEFERDRQIELIENGGVVKQQTRSFNAANGSTVLMRSKENANDYRYFPEPDLQPVILTLEYIQNIQKTLPLLPSELSKKFKLEYGLSEYDTNILVDDKDIGLYFLELCSHVINYKTAANIVIGSIKSYLNEKAISIKDFSVPPNRIAQLISLIDDGKVSNSVATQKIFPVLIESNLSAQEIAKSNNWIQESDSDSLSTYIDNALAKFPQKVEEYKAGKKGLIGLFMGEVMKLSKGKADPKLTNKMLQEKLNK